jgi:hypothetical protein
MTQQNAIDQADAATVAAVHHPAALTRRPQNLTTCHARAACPSF